MEQAFGGNWIKTMNTGRYMAAGDDPARVTWFEYEMLTLGQAAQQLGLPLAAEGCKQVSFEKTRTGLCFGLERLRKSVRLRQRGNQHWGTFPSELLIPKAEPAATACDVALIFANGS
jgi:hypothetical protein